MSSVTTKGQVTIPQSIRDYLGLKPGSVVVFERQANGEVVLRPAGKAGRRTRRVFAKIRGSATVRMSTDEILGLTRNRLTN
jgi:antitoxin PrlF